MKAYRDMKITEVIIFYVLQIVNLGKFRHLENLDSSLS